MTAPTGTSPEISVAWASAMQARGEVRSSGIVRLIAEGADLLEREGIQTPKLKVVCQSTVFRDQEHLATEKGHGCIREPEGQEFSLRTDCLRRCVSLVHRIDERRKLAKDGFSALASCGTSQIAYFGEYMGRGDYLI